MAIKTLADILTRVNALIGEDTSDESLTLIEDLTDTFNDQAESNNESWKKKYEDNDRTWRERYKERFLSGDSTIDKELENDEPEEEPKTYKFEDLFKEG